MEIEPKEQEKLAFQTHRGLWQFVRMPFGYKNGPSIFQHIMQNANLNQVFRAIEESGVTLAVTKCHFGYQSLLLLGQKVSRLGLSTHKEKVDAVVTVSLGSLPLVSGVLTEVSESF